METVEVKYFIQTARDKSVRKAAESIGISPSAISKAIRRLEDELETKLVEKVGRNLILTTAGKQFKEQGAEFLALERQIVESHNQFNGKFTIKIVGPELPMSHWGTIIVKQIYQVFPDANINFEAKSNNEALEMVDSFSADFALFITQKKLIRDKALTKKLDNSSMKTFVSNKHPLSKKRKISISNIINERFIVTNTDALSLFTENMPADGWRDDKFERKKIFYTDSLKALDSALLEGLGVSYLPEFYGKKLGLKEIRVTECPYACDFSVYLCRNKYGLKNIWSLF